MRSTSRVELLASRHFRDQLSGAAEAGRLSDGLCGQARRVRKWCGADDFGVASCDDVVLCGGRSRTREVGLGQGVGQLKRFSRIQKWFRS